MIFRLFHMFPAFSYLSLYVSHCLYNAVWSEFHQSISSEEIPQRKLLKFSFSFLLSDSIISMDNKKPLQAVQQTLPCPMKSQTFDRIHERRSANYKPNIWNYDYLQSLTSIYGVRLIIPSYILFFFKNKYVFAITYNYLQFLASNNFLDIIIIIFHSS